MYLIYQLRLIDNKHYFGTTWWERKAERMQEHINGRGSKWTERFPPVDENPIVNQWLIYDRKKAYAFENAKCEQFLEEYGIDSTRGGNQNYGDVGNYSVWVRKHLRHLCPTDYDWQI